MTWLPAGYTGNQSTASTLLYFLTYYFGGSHDEMLKNIYPAQDLNKIDFDFIIVGAGAAGCVVANRLSEQSDWKVLLLEAGEEEPLAANVPGLLAYLRNSNADYSYHTNDTKSKAYARGKVMGGSTTINGMVYARGAKADYDDWAYMGNTGWSWDDVLPYFMKSENVRASRILDNYSQYHGTGGNLDVDEFPVEDKYVPAIIDAFKEAGLQETDYNKGDQLGVGRIQFTSLHGSRMSTNGAFIRNIRGKRSNLIVRPNARATRIIIDKATKRATGVEYEVTNVDGSIQKRTANAAKEVIISAGFIESPKLLMLSGIGPKKDLQRLNIRVLKDLPVGHNLRDHYIVMFPLVSNNNVSMPSDQTIKSQLHEWLNTHEGPMSMRNGVNICAYHRTKFENRSGAADIEYEIWGEGEQNDGTLGNITIVTALVKAKSIGSIKLNINDSRNNQPDIRVNPLANSQDIDVLVEGLKFARKVANTLKNLGLSHAPSAECKNYEIESDEYLRCLVECNTSHNGHGSGTCKMGPKSDRTAVVNPRLKVRGIKGLRVIDASIMPRVIRANTMAPTIMIGEKGSDMIKEDWL